MRKDIFVFIMFALLLSALVAIIVAFVFLSLISIEEAKQNMPKTVLINDCELTTEIADTPYKRSLGLSNRESLDEDRGMLFVFDDYSRVGFWMKDMQFPLDIIWIQGDTIIDITENIPHDNGEDQLKSYYPPDLINYVIEVNAGWVEEHEIKVGDKVQVI